MNLKKQKRAKKKRENRGKKHRKHKKSKHKEKTGKTKKTNRVLGTTTTLLSQKKLNRYKSEKEHLIDFRKIVLHSVSPGCAL